MKKQISVRHAVLLCVLCAAVAVVAVLGVVTYVFGGVTGVKYAKKYADVASIIENRYIGDSDPEDVSDAALSAMITAIDDKWSYYMTAEEYESYKLYAKNAYTGIGVTITQDEESGGLLVVGVTEGGPADNAGICEGDTLLAIEDTDITGMTTAEVKTVIQQYNGENFAVKLLRADGVEETVTVTCEEITVNPVSYEMLDGNIGYIQIINFETGSAEGAITAVDELIQQGAQSLIFDVRSNPGGKVNQLTKLLDYLLPEGDIFVSVNKAGEETVTTSDADCIEIPMAVLVNANSYSAAELFAATLSEYDWATVVGEATTGKGRSQVTVDLFDGSAVHISTNAYLTPNRVDLSAVGGIVPDVEVELETQKDEQLAAAIKILS
jgi:carboxyl-terminal processing protease